MRVEEEHVITQELLQRMAPNNNHPMINSNDEVLLLFDLDGTLIDTEPVHYDAYRQLLSVRGLQLDWSFESYCLTSHCSSAGVKQRLLTQYPILLNESWDDLYREKKRYHMELLKQQKDLPLLPGVQQFLLKTLLPRVTRFVVTQSPRMATSVIWNRDHTMQLAFPDVEWNFVTQDDYKHSKPAPDAYLTAIDRYFSSSINNNNNNTTALTIVGFEDTPRGFESLKLAFHLWREQNQERAVHCSFYLLFMNCHQIPYPSLEQLLIPLNDHQQIIECKTGWSHLNSSRPAMDSSR